MNRSFAVFAAMVLGVALMSDVAAAQGQRSNVTMPDDAHRRSMGNLRPTAPAEFPVPSTPGSVNPATPAHRPWAYGRPPYYRQPPVQPYYVYPQPDYGYGYGYGYQPYYYRPNPFATRPYVVYPQPYGYMPYYPYR